MSRAPRKARTPSGAEPGTERRAMPEGRGHRLPAASAQAIADSLEAAGFPVPPNVQKALGEPDDQPAADAAQTLEPTHG